MASASPPRTIERYTRRGRTQVKPAGISQENAVAGFGLHRVVYVVVDTSGAQACHVRVVCINVNVNVNAKAQHGDPENPRALTGRATLSARLNSLCENNDGLIMPLDRHATMQIQRAGSAVSLCPTALLPRLGNVIFLFNNQCASRISISPQYEIEYLPLRFMSGNNCALFSISGRIIIYKCLHARFRDVCFANYLYEAHMCRMQN